MSYGVIEYDSVGKPICEICGKSFLRVMTHARQKHGINERQYKKKYGLDLLKGICSKESKEISRQRVFENYDLCITKNLLTKGENTRFLKKSKGRTADQVSEQTRKVLSKRWKEIGLANIKKINNG